MPKQNDVYSKADRKNGKDKRQNSRNQKGKYSNRNIRIKTQEMINKSKNDVKTNIVVINKKKKKK